MHRSAKRIFFLGTLVVFMPLGCTTRLAVCVLSTPGHQQDWERLQPALEAHGIRSPGAESNLGGSTFSIQGEDAERARQVLLTAISEQSLTVRISKDCRHPLIYDVYEGGRKIREESYVVK